MKKPMTEHGKKVSAGIARAKSDRAEFDKIRAEDLADLKEELAGGRIWCLHCERVWEVDKIGIECVCGADWAMDGKDYAPFVAQFPHYPKEPEHGKFRCSGFGDILSLTDGTL
jgi:hypothetical protein